MGQSTQSAAYEGSSGAAGSLSNDDREELKRLFDAQGYVIIRDVVSKAELSALGARVASAFELARSSGGLFSGGGTLTGHLNCFPGEQSRFAYDALQQRGIIDLVRAFCPRPFVTPNVGLNFNLPNSVTQHYHSDSAFLQMFVVLNVAVVDADLVNGAIDVVPGTHKKFYKYWRFATERPHRFNKRLPMQQGDVLIRASTLWHRGMPNRSRVARPMLALTFGQEQTEQQQRDPFGVNEGKIMFYENWYKTNRLGQLRERTYVAAPFTYSAYRFVRSLFGNKGYATF